MYPEENFWIFLSSAKHFPLIISCIYNPLICLNFCSPLTHLLSPLSSPVGIQRSALFPQIHQSLKLEPSFPFSVHSGSPFVLRHECEIFFSITYLYYLCRYVSWCSARCWRATWSPFPPCTWWVQLPNSGHRAWQQTPFPAEPCLRPEMNII